MEVIKVINRMKRMDRLIRMKGTGSPNSFADKLNISRSSLYQYIGLLKELNGPIEYDKHRQSYYYIFDCELKIGYECNSIDNKELIKINKKSMRKFCQTINFGQYV